jgi:hypothetical protein
MFMDLADDPRENGPTGCSATDRDGIGPGSEPVSLREVMVEQIHENGRHVGQADLLRERIDGLKGQ